LSHEGSKEFRKLIDSYTLPYQQASTRQEKMDVTKEIFDLLQAKRFLKMNEEVSALV